MPKLTREQAIADCKELWKYLAMTGLDDKSKACRILFNKNKISRLNYNNYCPLCEKFKTIIKYSYNCNNCPWPGEINYRCESLGSPYEIWKDNRTKKNASKVYQLVKTFK
jgi:hypothetical protein